MRTTTLVSRAVLLFGLVALAAVTHVNAQGPTFTGLNGWTPGTNNNNNNPYNPDPNSNNNDNSDNGNSTDNGNDDGNGTGDGSGDGGASGNGNGSGSGDSGSNNGGNYGGYDGGFGNSGGSSSSSPFGSGLDGLNDGLEYASLVSYRAAHGVLASVAFAFLFPLGAILLRSVPGRGALHSHWIVQVVASVLYLIAAGLGLYLLSIIRIPSSGAGLLDVARGNAHPIIGIVLLVALFAQPVFGILHHRRFQKLHRRTWASYVHLWIGRLGITLGIINGGLGLALADAKGAPVVAYAVISSVMWSLWVLATALRALRDARSRTEKEDSEIMAKIAQDDREYLARAHSERAGSGTATPRMENTGARRDDSVRSSAAPVSTAAEQDIPSPPYTPGPHYEAHMAHATHQRQRQFGRGEMQSIKEAMDGSDSVSIISASQDEMRRGQV
ncbi:hypothetical protein F4782DRAFT_513167 [Xylaria castorea]|nr:hypothetical protein F4782DRAFT_513167 [Xylaria castorea]